MGSANIQAEKPQEKRLEAELKVLRTYVPPIVRRAIARDPERPPLDRHMRDLTVLFMDIAGCTRLCELLSPGRMQDLIEKYFSSFIDEVDEFGGTINETAGDGLMILFLNGSRGSRPCCRPCCISHPRAHEGIRDLLGRRVPGLSCSHRGQLRVPLPGSHGVPREP